MKKANLNVFEKYKAFNQIGDTVPVPWQVGRVFDIKTIRILPGQVGLSEWGDCVSLEEARQALDFMVIQLGGKVTWSAE